MAYYSVLDAWERCLYSQREVITRWYNIDGGRYTEEGRYFHALTKLVDWKVYFCLAGENPVLLDGPNNFDTQDLPHFYVRLWKGPLGILLGEESQPELNDNKEVINGDAEFLPGDVIEFPLFTFLQQCGKDEYGGVGFNPDGSFFLGTSLIKDSRPLPDSIRLHDNLLGMKFQLLLNLAMGAFYYLDRAVRGVGFAAGGATAGRQKVCSRGIIYGGSLAKPTASHLTDGSFWAIVDNGWGNGSVPPLNHPQNLPSARSIRSWNGSDLLTSAWSCSPCALFLSHYLLGLWDGYGFDSVDTMMQPICSVCRGERRRRCRHTEAERLRCEREHPRPLQPYLVKRWDSHNREDLATPPSRETVEGADITVLSLQAHEKSIVRIYPPGKLLGEESLPTHGFLSAYDPLDGRGYLADTEDFAARGGVFFFEAQGALSRWNFQQGEDEYSYSVFGVNPFNWRYVRDQDDVFPDSLSRLYTTGDNALNDPARVTGNLKPIVILDMNGGRAVSNHEELYANRAVPFPTMDEVSGKFPTISSIHPSKIQTARRAAQHPPAGAAPAPSAAYIGLLSP
ncbi:MAG: hypothetical protein A3K30_04475 [Deltaproteobacteria bacterium RBG_13_51_10]|nr:MAG: hypothetical protein A3K30_04475 [Deltaproteobacteria bacterium RBG_13_51_10]